MRSNFTLSKEEMQFIEENMDTMKIKAIANELNIPYYRVANHLNAMSKKVFAGEKKIHRRPPAQYSNLKTGLEYEVKPPLQIVSKHKTKVLVVSI